MELDVLGDVAADVRRRRLEAEQLLDGVRDERRVLDQLAALVGVLGQHLAGPADEAGGGLVAGAGDDGDVGEELVAAQAPHGAGLVLELGVEQLGHDVVGRVLGPPVDVLGELSAVGRCSLDTSIGSPASVRRLRVDPVADGLLVLLRDAEQHADHAHRHLGAEVGDEVEASGRRRADRGIRAQSSRIFGSSAATFFGVNTRDSRLRWIVCVGGSSKMTTPGGISMSALMISRIRAPPGDERVPVDERPLDVVVAAQRVEVVRLVVVERRLVAEAAERRVRVGVDRRRRTGRSTGR